MTAKRPVTVVGGFLGSGKTTLLRRALAGESAPGVAVVVNEFGEIGLDHHLVRETAEQTVVLAGGCACCNRRADLVQALRSLLDQDQLGAIPGLRRVVIETSGLADPAPVLFTIATDPVLQHHFRVDRVVVTVDALNGELQLDRHPETVKQAMVADEIVVTKVDVAGPGQAARLVARLRSLNRSARITESAFGQRGAGGADAPLETGAGGADASLQTGAASLLLEDDGRGRAPLARIPDQDGAHTAGTGSLALALDRPLNWVAFGIWLSLLLHAHGEEVLRVKGLLETEEVGMLAINGVQHVIHPPQHVDVSSGEVRGSRLVFVTRGIDPALIERSLRAFQRVSEPGP